MGEISSVIQKMESTVCCRCPKKEELFSTNN
jgi:hypothetical protein